MNAVPISSMIQALPEIVLALGAMALLMLGAYRENSTRAVNILAVLLLIVAAIIVVNIPNGTIFGGSFIVDDYARYMKILAYAGSAFAIVMSLDYLAAEREEKFEYAILILLSTVGMGMLISAGDLIALYLGLELMAGALRRAATNRDYIRSAEAAEYFVLGALSSACCSAALADDGFTGNVSFGHCQASGHGGIGLIFGLLFLFAGLCFRVRRAVPHGRRTSMRRRRGDRLCSAPKIVRWRFSPAPPRRVPGSTVAADIVFVRSPRWCSALRRHQPANIKRLMAYSSIGMGFALIGLAAGTAEASSVLVMAIYCHDTVGTSR